MATVPETATPESEAETRSHFLRRVRIRGYKSIAFCDVPLEPMTILVGRNGAGKSNFLDALAFLRDVIHLGVREAVHSRGGWSSVVCQSVPTRSIQIDLDIAYVFCPFGTADPELRPLAPVFGNEFSASYSIEIINGAGRSPTVEGEFLRTCDQKTGSVYGVERRGRSVTPFHESGPNDTDLFATFLSSWLAPPPADQLFLRFLYFPILMEIRDGLQQSCFHSLAPETIRQLQKPDTASMHKDGRNLASVLRQLKDTEPETFQRLQEYLALVTDEVASFDVVTYGEYETIRFRLRSSDSEAPLEFDAASMSDGTLRALGALVAAFQIHEPPVSTFIGIEEPEACLHPAAMRALVGALSEATSRNQILLTTHSADMLDDENLDPSQILVVRNRSGQTQITPVDAASREIIHKELYTLADLHRMDQLDLDEEDLQRQEKLQASNGKE